MVNERQAPQSDIKQLISKGLEQGYLTYAEVNDHLPDDLVDPEQIEDIIGMINGMGIEVHEVAPDVDTLLLAEGTTGNREVDDTAAEEAAATLTALDGEGGRTTDPVRMYMREMGTVELLTREGEIEIAKRIEGGLQAMMLAISASPTTIAELLSYADRIVSGDMKISEVVDGFVSEGEADDYVAEEDVDFFDEEDDDDGQGGSKALTKKLEELKAAALIKFESLRGNFDKMRKAFEKDGYQGPSYSRAQQTISAELMTIRFTVKTIEKLCGILRSQVDDVRRYERELRKILIDKCGMPQEYFIKHFPPNILNLKWSEKEVALNKGYSAILARSLHIPLVIGAAHVLQKVNDGDVLAVDGGSGLVILEPNPDDLREHRARVQGYTRERKQLHRLRREPTRTRDGVDIKLWANAESREDVAEAHALGAAGVGLYRTEFLFMHRPADLRHTLPDEEEQFRAYRDLVLGMTGRTVTIRTLDIGADKADESGLALTGEPNPALGLRGVRLSLSRIDLFRTQLRAILRASAYGPLRVLVPMVSGREEMVAVRSLMGDVQRELRGEGCAIADAVPLGAMIEVPSAAIALQSFIDTTDFLSIGTNDLVQYLLAADRTNDALGELYSPLHPAVLRLLYDVIRIARTRGKPLAVCGEIAGDPMFTPVLLALGLEEFSLHPGTLLELRREVRRLDLSALRARTATLLRARDRASIERWLAQAMA